MVVVHYCGHPADMDRVMEIACRTDSTVIEDVSHAQGGLCGGREIGTFGDVAAMSLMSGKSLAIGEAGMLVTDDEVSYERAVAWGHYSRSTEDVHTPYLKAQRAYPSEECRIACTR